MIESKIKELIDDIQTGGDMKWWNIVGDFPDIMKGSIAKRLWHDDKFGYGMEYGALIILDYLLDQLQSSTTEVKTDG